MYYPCRSNAVVSPAYSRNPFECTSPFSFASRFLPFLCPCRYLALLSLTPVSLSSSGPVNRTYWLQKWIIQDYLGGEEERSIWHGQKAGSVSSCVWHSFIDMHK